MFILLRKNRGQSYAIEYALLFFLVVAAISAMSLYLRRAVQGRIRDARNYMAMTVNNVYDGDDLRVEYEPYYINTTTGTYIDSQQSTRLFGSFPSPSGIAQRVINSTTSSSIVGNTLPPRNFYLTE